MKKQRLDIEYPLSARKPDIVWGLISTDHGMGRWLADDVNEENGIISFTWGQPWTDHHTLSAHVVEREKNSHIRFRWVDEDDDDAYWEMRIGHSELTGEICLCVVDYAPADEVDDLHSLWDGNMDRLHQSSGL
ncbi:MAG: hypothetical protein IJ841_11010 [Prevotella sp.]|nr:hypothetical protein [Prevotella sp.]